MSLSSPVSRHHPEPSVYAPHQNSAWHYLSRLQTRSRTCMFSFFNDIVESTTSTPRVCTSTSIYVSQSRFANPLHWSNGPGKCQLACNCALLRLLDFSCSTTARKRFRQFLHF